MSIMISNRLAVFVPILVLHLINKTSRDVHAFWYYDEYTCYYTITLKPIVYEVTPQDDIDAQAIVDAEFSEQVFGSILPYREKVRRITINRELAVKNAGQEYIDDHYMTQEPGTPRYKDLLFALVYDEESVIGTYLGNFMMAKDETFIIIGLVLTKTMDKMQTVYDQQHSHGTFEDMRDHQRKPFKNMMRVWISENREPIEQTELNQSNVMNDAIALKKENEDGGWHENRDQIEKITMKKSIKYAKAVIKEFEKQYNNKAIESIIIENIDAHDLNHDLADAYASLARYIKNKHKYIADILRQYSDGVDQWAVWIMCIAVVDPREWPKVDHEFQKDHKDGSLSQFIVKKCTEDRTMAEIMAAVIDPSFKPTKFTKKPLKGAITSAPPTIMNPAISGPVPAPFTPPPAPPTTVKPS